MIITLKSNEVELLLSPYGASIYQLKTKNKYGEFKNIELSYNDLSIYENGNPSFFGATCGRFAGRITNAKFDIDGTTYNLSKNFHGKHTLHGGSNNLTKKLWNHEVIENNGKSICKFTCSSNHMEEGFPGNIEVLCEYILWNNTLTINYYATSDRKTYLNLTNHGFFNLSDNSDTIYNHNLQLHADKYVSTDEIVIPKEIKSVDNTEYDFRTMKQIGNLYNKKDELLKTLNGYDTCFILDKKNKDFDLYLKDEESGRSLKCKSTYPIAILYSYNVAKDYEILDRKNIPHVGMAIEFQYAPNAMNRDDLKIPIVDVDNPYNESITFTFNE